MNYNEKIYKALVFAKEGKWHEAHEIAQSKEGHPDFDRLHALVHRIEGDAFNARYWYNICKLKVPSVTIDQEISELMQIYGPE